MVRAVKSGNLTVAKPLIRLLVVILVVLMTLPAVAQRMKDKADSLDYLEFHRDQTWLTMNGAESSSLGAEAPSAMVGDIEALRTATGIPWIAMIDRITGKPSLIEGGMPWIPGTGLNNNLRPEDFGITALQAAKNEMPLEKVDEIAKNFLRQYPNLFNVDEKDLVLAEEASGPMFDYLYSVNYRYTYYGIPVENAWLNFHLNSGNLVMFGATYISDSIKKLDPVPALSAETANEIMWAYIGEKPTPNDKILEPGRLVIQPFSTSAVINETSYAFGQGMEYRLVYVVVFRRDGVMGDWEARIDAHTGELISFKDINAYGHIQGGVFKTDKNHTQTEVSVPFPYANYSGTTSYADEAGNFTGTTGTSTMRGIDGTTNQVGAAYITDNCGSISKASDGTGLIDFSTSTGTNCTIPASGGGAGNTRAARTQYWNVTQLKIKAYAYQTTNDWLEDVTEITTNYNSYCNAVWTGGATGYAIFYRNGNGCGNTGELPGVSLHEVGHGFDYNDGNGFSPEGGTGEIYGDTTAMLQTHHSCAGGGIWLTYNMGCGTVASGYNCSGYGNCCTDCSGVREADYAKHDSATMATPNNFCLVNCPDGYSCEGPCSRECHCENAPGAQANWDLAVRVFPSRYGMDSSTAWQYLDKYWYASANSRLAAFVCGNNTSTGTGNLFNQYRVVDDCDGVLTNGTPHAAGIYQALGTNHQIGNSSAVSTDNTCSCASLATPVLSGTAGDGQVSLSWAAITGAGTYEVYRNEVSCTSGFTMIGTTTSTSFTDSPLYNGNTYYYKIRALNGTTPACPPSAMSNCQTLTPAAGGCTAPGAPNLTAATGACTGNDLTWTAGTGTTLSYNVYRFTGACGGAYTKLAGMPVTGTSYSDTTAVAGTSYAYVVRGCCDAAGTTESVNSNCRTATRTTVPAAPTGVSATAGCTGNTVTWTNSPTATSHNVLRGTTCGTVLNTFTGVTTPYNDTSAVAGTAYYYWVVGVNACGTSAISSCSAQTTRLATPAAPGAPTFTNVSCNTLTVNWTAVSGATSYSVYRKTGANCSGAVEIASGIAGTTYNDTGLSASTQYGYNVVATNTCGSSANGTCATVTTTGVPTAPTGVTATPGCTGNSIAWGAVSGATSYNVLRGTTCGTILNTFTGVTSPYNDTTAVAGTTYNYWVVAINSCGTSADSSCATAARLAVPAAPTGVTATPGCTGNSISWSGTATSFNVLRGTTCGAILNTFTGVTSPYNDTTAVAGTTYNYWVVGINTCGTSANSSCATAARLVSPTPTISGDNANTCPATTVALSTQNGMSGYQWYLGGTPIGGATSYQYTATASGSYTVSYTAVNGCSGTSAAHVVTISPCVPNIVYSTHGTFTQVTGNGDSYYDLGEKWSVQVTLQNTGNVAATNVTATLEGNGIEVCEPVQPFGNIAVSGTGNATYEFVISPTFTPCGGSIGFDVTTKTSTELTPAGTDETDVFSITVGQGGAGVVTLFGPDDAPYTSGSWTWGGGSTQTVAHCSHTDAYGRLNQDTYCTLNTGLVSTVGYTNIQVTFDWSTFNMDAGGTDYLLLQYYNGTAWVDSGFSTYQNSWTCGQTVTLPAGAEGVSNFQIRFRAEGNSASSNERAGIDYVTITADGGSADCSYVGSGTCEVCVTPGTPVINGVADVSACAQSGVQVNYTANTPYTTHDLYVDGSLAVSDYVSGATYNPGNTSSHDYVVRAINGLDTCFADSSESAGADANNTPGAPTVTAVNDVSACAQSGVQVVYTAGSGAASHNLYDNGSLAVTGYASGATYDPGNTASHTYTVYAINGTCTSTVSNSMAGTDASGTPAAPTATNNGPICAGSTLNLYTGTVSGATYSWTGPNGFTSSLEDPSIASATTAASGTYSVTVTVGGCTSAAGTTNALVNALPTPSIGGANANTCPAEYVNLTATAGMTTYQWYLDGSPVGTGASTYQATASGSYTVYVTDSNGCGGTSAPHAVTITTCAVVPGEVAVGTNFTWSGQTMNWTAHADATGYRVYRGLLSNLSALCDGTNDFCTRNDAASTSLDVTGDDPSGQAGRCFYYLITGYSGAGEGPAGTATCGTRQVNQTGGCS